MTINIKKSKLESRRGRWGYVFTFPFIIGAVLGVIYPVVLSLVYSFGELIPQEIGYKINFVGIENYKTLFTVDPDFTRELVETLQNTILKVPVAIIFSFFLACVLNTEFRGRGLARTVLFLPMIISSKLVKSLLNQDIVSSEMSNKGAEEAVMLSDKFAEFLMSMNVGDGLADFLTSSVNDIQNLLYMSVIPTIIILAGLQSVSRSIYEASYVEGATSWEVLWKISLPMVSPLLLVSLLYCVIDSFTGVGNSIISRVGYECFTAFNFGIGSAVAWSYLIVVLLIVAVVFLIANRFVSYDT